MMELSPGKLWGMRRMADAGGRFKMVAVDQRPPIKNPIREKRGTSEAPFRDVAGFKLMLVEELQNDASAMLLDPHYALPGGLTLLSPAKGVIVTLEDSVFRETDGGRLSAEIDEWSVEKIKRVGGDAVKVLAWYRPDAERQVCLAQQDFTARIGEACARYDIPYLFELLVYPLPGEKNHTTSTSKWRTRNPTSCSKACASSPTRNSASTSSRSKAPCRPARSRIRPRARSRMCSTRWAASAVGHGSCCRPAPGWRSSRTSSLAPTRRVLRATSRDARSGPSPSRPSRIGRRSAPAALAEPSYMRELNALTDRAATPWFEHTVYGGKVGVPRSRGAFRRAYKGF